MKSKSNNNLFNVLSITDLFSYQPHLCFNGKQGYYTIIGTIISLFFYIIMLLMIILFFEEYINNYQINSYESNYDILNFNVSLKDINYMYKLYDNKGYKVPENIIRVYHQLKTNNETINLNSKECNNNQLILSDNSSIYECISLDNEESLDKLILNKVNVLDIYVAKCENSSMLQFNNCQDNEVINKYLTDNIIYFETILPYDIINNDDKKNPIYKQNKKYIQTLQNNQLNYKTFSLHKLKYISDNGIIFKNKKNYEGYTAIEESSEINKTSINNNEKILSKISIYISNDINKTYIRKYQKLQNTLALIGGILGFFINLFSMISYILTKSLYFKDLALLPIDEKYNKDREEMATMLVKSIVENKKKLLFNNLGYTNQSNESNLKIKDNLLCSKFNKNKDNLSLLENNDKYILESNNKTLSEKKREKLKNISSLKRYSVRNSELLYPKIRIKNFSSQKNFFSTKNKNIINTFEIVSVIKYLTFCETLIHTLFPFYSRNKKIQVLNRFETIATYILSADEIINNSMKKKFIAQSQENTFLNSDINMFF